VSQKDCRGEDRPGAQPLGQLAETGTSEPRHTVKAWATVDGGPRTPWATLSEGAGFIYPTVQKKTRPIFCRTPNLPDTSRTGIDLTFEPGHFHVARAPREPLAQPGEAELSTNWPRRFDPLLLASWNRVSRIHPCGHHGADSLGHPYRTADQKRRT
jgi:hypothetical protein